MEFGNSTFPTEESKVRNARQGSVSERDKSL